MQINTGLNMCFGNHTRRTFLQSAAGAFAVPALGERPLRTIQAIGTPHQQLYNLGPMGYGIYAGDKVSYHPDRLVIDSEGTNPKNNVHHKKRVIIPFDKKNGQVKAKISHESFNLPAAVLDDVTKGAMEHLINEFRTNPNSPLLKHIAGLPA